MATVEAIVRVLKYSLARKKNSPALGELRDVNDGAACANLSTEGLETAENETLGIGVSSIV